MTDPVRIQRKREKGWRLPPNTFCVDRSSAWGNPYWVDDMHASWSDIHDPKQRAQACVDHYERMVLEGFVTVPYTILTAKERGRGDGLQSVGAHKVTEVARKYLGGKNLACFCALDMPCHADVLLRLANPPICEAGR